MKLKELTEGDVLITIRCEPEEDTIEGNALASGDEEEDRREEERIRKELYDGNNWAWCTITVRATWQTSSGIELFGEDTIGCCSYDGEDSFKKDGYYADMVGASLAALNDKLAALADVLDLLVVR